MNESINNEIRACFDTEIYYFKALNDLLKSEQAALVRNNIEAIEESVEVKSRLIKRINTASRSRHAALLKMGFDESETGMIAWLSSMNEEFLVKKWASIRELLHESKELNRLNAMLVNKFISRNQQTIEKIQRSSKQGTSQIYGPDGMKATKKPNGGSVFS